jgi:hypothetical protein
MSNSNEASTSLPAIRRKVHNLVNCHLKGEKNLSQVRESVERWWNTTHPLDRSTIARNLDLVLAESFAALAEIRKDMAELDRKSQMPLLAARISPKQPGTDQ